MKIKQPIEIINRFSNGKMINRMIRKSDNIMISYEKGLSIIEGVEIGIKIKEKIA